MLFSHRQTFFLVELMVPWADRIEASNVMKTVKYSGLAKDLEDSAFLVKLMLVEVRGEGFGWEVALHVPHSNRFVEPGKN